jgi:hypothetical protein
VALTINPGIVVGTPFTLKSSATTTTTLSRLTDTTFVAAYGSSSLLYARHVTNAAGTLSAGTELPIQANATFLESCQLTATRVIVTGRNATVSNQGYYWLIDNTSGTTIANNVSGSFNDTASYTFPSKILDNRVLVGSTGNSSYGQSYVLDLSTETLKSIAGIAKEAGVESNVIDVVTQGECDFLIGLTPGSYYYSSGTGFLSASVGDYEVGVAKSATNLKLNSTVQQVNKEWLAKADILFAANRTPNLFEAQQYGVWTTRTVNTGTGTFTVPAGVYYLGIACCGGGGNGTTSGGSGGGGGLALKVKKVVPGQQIPYENNSKVASCDGMVANPGTNGVSNAAGVGGSATGGTYNYAGGNGSYTNASAVFPGGGGLGGGTGGGVSSSSYSCGGGAGFAKLMWNEYLGTANGGYAGEGGRGAGGGGAGGNGGGFTNQGYRNHFGGSLGKNANDPYSGSGQTPQNYIPGGRLCYPKLMSMQMGFIIQSDFNDAYDVVGTAFIDGGQNTAAMKPSPPSWGCGGYSHSYYSNTGQNFAGSVGAFGGGGGGVGEYVTITYVAGSGGGFGGGGGGGGGNNYGPTYGGNGGFGGGGGGVYGGYGGNGGIGGGGGCGGWYAGTGGTSAVVFIY